MKAIILLGAPGAGKGTVAEQIRVTSGYVHVSTGDMLRKALKEGAELGKEAEAYMKRGELVPDELIIKLVDEFLDQSGSDSYMFDGFPRTIAQADLLEKTLSARDGKIRKVFFLDTPRDVLISRLTGRRICRDCGTNFHVVNKNKQPKVEGICDACGGELYHRPDDQEATIVNRLEVFNKQTETLISYYQDKDLLFRVDSNRTADEIVSDMSDML